MFIFENKSINSNEKPIPHSKSLEARSSDFLHTKVHAKKWTKTKVFNTKIRALIRNFYIIWLTGFGLVEDWFGHVWRKDREDCVRRVTEWTSEGPTKKGRANDDLGSRLDGRFDAWRQQGPSLLESQHPGDREKPFNRARQEKQTLNG